MALDVHVHDVPVLNCSYLRILRGAGFEHVMGSNDESGLFVSIDRSMSSYNWSNRFQIEVFDVEEVEGTSQGIYTCCEGFGDLEFHLDVDTVCIIKVVADDVDCVDIIGESLVESDEEINSLSWAKAEVCFIVNGLMHKGGICANYCEGEFVIIVS